MIGRNIHRNGMETERCPSCGSSEGNPVLHYRDVPAFLFPMPRKAAQEVIRSDIDLFGCATCGHLFQQKVDQALLSTIYVHYYQYYPLDDHEALLPHYREPFQILFGLIAKTSPRLLGGRLLEIGCSKSENMTCFLPYGFTCTGVDPSPMAQEEPLNREIRILHGFYESISLPEKMDVIVSRFSLEHVADLDLHLGKISSDLKDGGLVFLQVPNVSYYLLNRQPFFIAHEHVHYFSLKSLCALFQRFGMFPIAFYEENQPSIVACFRKDGPKVSIECMNLFEYLPAYQAASLAKNREIRAILATENRLVLYGSGLLAFWVLGETSPEELHKIILVDDHPKLWGRFVPSYGVEVKPPSVETFFGTPKVILSLNPFYHDEVIRRLLAFKVPCGVVTIDRDGVRQWDIDQV